MTLLTDASGSSNTMPLRQPRRHESSITYTGIAEPLLKFTTSDPMANQSWRDKPAGPFAYVFPGGTMSSSVHYIDLSWTADFVS